MRAVMHQDREAELARTDEDHGDDVGQRVGKDRDQCDRAEDHGPRMGDQRNALPFDALAQRNKLIARDQLARGNAKSGCGGGHDDLHQLNISPEPLRQSPRRQFDGDA